MGVKRPEMGSKWRFFGESATWLITAQLLFKYAIRSRVASDESLERNGCKSHFYIELRRKPSSPSRPRSDRFWLRELRVSRHFSTFYGPSVQDMGMLGPLTFLGWQKVAGPFRFAHKRTRKMKSKIRKRTKSKSRSRR